MAKSFRCKVITPDSQLLSEPVTSVTLPLWDGLMGILPNRAPIVAKLGMGELKVDFAPGASIKSGEKAERTFYIEEGFMQMTPGVAGGDDAAAGGVLTILTTKAIAADKLVESEVKAELQAAEAKSAAPGDTVAAEAIRKDRERARRKLAVAQANRGR